jgi:hypothetical protein
LWSFYSWWVSLSLQFVAEIPEGRGPRMAELSLEGVRETGRRDEE